MLVLSRKKGEEIVLCVEGQTVRVRIVNVNGKTVRLGNRRPAGSESTDSDWRRLRYETAGRIRTPS